MLSLIRDTVLHVLRDTLSEDKTISALEQCVLIHDFGAVTPMVHPQI